MPLRGGAQEREWWARRLLAQAGGKNLLSREGEVFDRAKRAARELPELLPALGGLRMTASKTWLAALALSALAGCAHEKPKNSWMDALACAARANRAMVRVAVPKDAGDESRRKYLEDATDETRQEYFSSYYESFLEAAAHQETISCLKKQERGPAFRENIRQAKGWLKASQENVKLYGAFYPKAKRIIDAKESFLPLEGTPTLRRVTVTLRDGTKIVVEEPLSVKTPRKD
jgi:hypothetical protein